MFCILSSVLILLWSWYPTFAPMFWKLSKWPEGGFHFLRFLQAGYLSSCLHGLSMLVFWLWSILWQLESRRCYGCLCCEFYFAECCQWYTLKSSVSSFSLLFVRPMSCILSNVSVLLWWCSIFAPRFWRTFRWPEWLFPIFWDFYKPVIVRSVWSLHVCFLILVHFVTHWISQMLRMSSSVVMHW